jgi:hypothetical protein
VNPACGLLSTYDFTQAASTCRSSRSSKRRRHRRSATKVAKWPTCAPTRRHMHSLYRVFKTRTVSVVSKANSTSSKTMTRVQECCKMGRSESVDQDRDATGIGEWGRSASGGEKPA